MTTRKTGGASGFSLARRDCVLRFDDDHELAGLEITARLDIPLKLFLEFSAAISGEDSDGNTFAGAFTLWATDILIEWNLEDDDGKPIEASIEAFFQLPPRVCTEIIQCWSSEVSEPPPPLGSKSNNLRPSDLIKEGEMVL